MKIEFKHGQRKQRTDINGENEGEDAAKLRKEVQSGGSVVLVRRALAPRGTALADAQGMAFDMHARGLQEAEDAKSAALLQVGQDVKSAAILWDERIKEPFNASELMKTIEKRVALISPDDFQLEEGPAPMKRKLKYVSADLPDTVRFLLLLLLFLFLGRSSR